MRPESIPKLRGDAFMDGSAEAFPNINGPNVRSCLRGGSGFLDRGHLLDRGKCNVKPTRKFSIDVGGGKAFKKRNRLRGSGIRKILGKGREVFITEPRNSRARLTSQLQKSGAQVNSQAPKRGVASEIRRQGFLEVWMLTTELVYHSCITQIAQAITGQQTYCFR